MTKFGCKRTLPRTSSLRHTPLRKVSKKQSTDNHTWSNVKSDRIQQLRSKFGFVMCEFCREAIYIGQADAHHNNRKRHGIHNTLANCRILHRTCHSHVHDKSIYNVPDLLFENQPKAI